MLVAAAAVPLLCACCGCCLAAAAEDDRKCFLACGVVCLALAGAALGLGWWLGAFADDDAGSF